MKKALTALTAALAAFVFAGCSRVLIEDLLMAPALTSEQSAVIEAVEGISLEKTILKYPQSGDDRTPIHFIDLDGDSRREAVVFFAIPAEGLKARVAVLNNEQGKWAVVSQLEGGGTDVESVDVIKLADSPDARFLLVRWSSSSISENRFSVYRYDGAELSVGFEERCSGILVLDMDGDSFSEFVYISESAVSDNAILNYVDHAEGTFTLRGTALLKGRFAGSSLTEGTLNDGAAAVFVDETVSDELQATEVFTLRDGTFGKADYLSDYDIFALSERPEGVANCSRFAAGLPTYIPTVSVPFEGIISKDDLTFWYSTGEGQVRYETASYIFDEYRCSLALPNEWLGFAQIVTYEENPRLMVITDAQSGEIIFEMQVLSVGDDAEELQSSGFELIGRYGSYRFFARSRASQQDTDYIFDNFTIL